MNFLKGRVVADNGRVLFDAGGLTLDVPSPTARAAARRKPPETTLGVRPEHLLLAPPALGQTVARTELIEPVGPVTYLDLIVGERSLRASVQASQRYQIGQEVGISVAADQAHFSTAQPGRGSRAVRRG
jgi:ABC-type sugar transport system ATPase subunit